MVQRKYLPSQNWNHAFNRLYKKLPDQNADSEPRAWTDPEMGRIIDTESMIKSHFENSFPGQLDTEKSRAHWDPEDFQSAL